MSAQGAADGSPTCDTCGLPAVWSKTLGWVHVTKDHPHGVPPHLDPSDHEVTTTWWVMHG